MHMAVARLLSGPRRPRTRCVSGVKPGGYGGGAPGEERRAADRHGAQCREGCGGGARPVEHGGDGEGSAAESGSGA